MKMNPKTNFILICWLKIIRKKLDIKIAELKIRGELLLEWEFVFHQVVFALSHDEGSFFLPNFLFITSNKLAYTLKLLWTSVLTVGCYKVLPSQSVCGRPSQRCRYTITTSFCSIDCKNVINSYFLP